MVAFIERTDWRDKGSGGEETVVYAADLLRYERGIAGLYGSRVADQSIMAMGDSLSAVVADHDTTTKVDRHDGPGGGHTGSDYLFGANLLLDSPFDVLGSAATSGMTVEQIRDTQLPKVLAAAPTYCVCWSLGANNALAAGQFPRSMLDISMGILDRLEANGTTPILFTLPPVNGGGDMSWDETDRYNTWASRVAQVRGYPFLDVHALLVDTATGGYRAGLSDDALHPNARGGAIISAALAELLRKLDRTGTRALLLDVNLLEGGSVGTAGNPHLAGTATTPNDWYIQPGATSALAAQPNGRPGNQLTLTNTQAAPQANAFGLSLPCKAGDVWDLAVRVGADVPLGGSWGIGLLDPNQGSPTIARAYGQTLTIPDTRILHWRGVAPPGAQRLSFYAAAEGTIGTTIRLAQVTLRNLSVKNIPI